jgi:DNA-binding helix-hairpin-helix protein with protein kinase domain
MPKISSRKEIHHLTSPRTRQKDFPGKGWAFQIHVAKNLASAIETIHEAGVIVGDINEKGFLIGTDGTLRVIDCDSFQLSHGGRLFKCEVGVPDYTPPELQSLPGGFASVVRTEYHDGFGLAVIIFKLLFQGRHPFMGRFSGIGDPELQRFIREHRFAYARNGATKQIAPPPHSLHLGALTPVAATLFEQAFSEDAARTGRPTGRAWYHALHELAGQLAACSRNDGHEYLKSLSSCPWCSIETSSGVVFFFGKVAVQAGGWVLNVGYFAGAIAKLPEIKSPALPQPSVAATPRELPDAVVTSVTRRRRFRLVLAILGLLTLASYGLFPGALWPAGGLIVLLIAWVLGPPGALTEERGRRQDIVASAEEMQKRVETEWKQIPVGAYGVERRKLQDTLKKYGDLQLAHTRGLAELEQRKREAQLIDHLDDFPLRTAKIPGIGKGRLANLDASGIVTAADITPKNLEDVPGIGPTLVRVLLEWRRSHEATFRFDPSKPVDPREMAKLMQRLQGERQALETAMHRQITALSTMARTITERQAIVLSRAEMAAKAVAQAQVDLQLAMR